jgi:hypothetical protein
VLTVAATALAGPSMGKTMWMDGFIAAALLGATAFAAFLVAGSFWLVGVGWRRIVDRYSAGGYMAVWTYADAQWRGHLARRGKRMRNTGLLFVLAFSISGVVVAWQMQQDDDMIFSKPEVNYAVLTVAGALVGVLVALTLRLGRTYRRWRLGRREPRCVVGWDGFYIGGEFVPIRSVWQRALAMAVQADGEPRIEVHLRVVTGQAVIRRTDIIPVPPGREAEARGLVAALGF